MEQKAPIIVIDTDVFVRDLRYVRDRNYPVNKRFLELIHNSKSGVTTIFTLLETCGILSFNLNSRQLRELFFYFPKKYGIEILPTHTLDGSMPQINTMAVYAFIDSRMSFGDALISAALETFVPSAEIFVSWNARHFAGLKIKAMTPGEYMTLVRKRVSYSRKP